MMNQKMELMAAITALEYLTEADAGYASHRLGLRQQLFPSELVGALADKRVAGQQEEAGQEP